MYKLLLVDDEAIIRDGIRTMIDWPGLGITLTAICPDALSALDSMLDDMPDILMTDVRMPGINGLELIERAVLLHPQLQTLILSGYDEFDYARQAIKFGVREYLLKPCSREEMESALGRVCRAVDAQRADAWQRQDARRQKLREMTGRLHALRDGSLPEEALRERVHQLNQTEKEPNLLREALLHLISDVNASQAEWGFSVMQNALKKPEELEQLTVQALCHLRGETGIRGFVQKMAAYVNDHYGDETLSLQYLADHVVYMNADYIGREFSRCLGTRFSAYVLKVRMERAKTLIEDEPGLHSYQIAERVGLGNNPHYFSQVFRKYTGMTVTEYRAERRKTTEK